eukprot:gene37980-49782_t
MGGDDLEDERAVLRKDARALAMDTLETSNGGDTKNCEARFNAQSEWMLSQDIDKHVDETPDVVRDSTRRGTNMSDQYSKKQIRHWDPLQEHLPAE